MNKSEVSTLTEEVVNFLIDVTDEYIAEVVDTIGDVGSPEKLIGKKYEEWTPEDLQRLAGVYGAGDDTPLAKLILSKEYEKVLKLESEV